MQTYYNHQSKSLWLECRFYAAQALAAYNMCKAQGRDAMASSCYRSAKNWLFLANN